MSGREASSALLRHFSKNIELPVGAVHRSCTVSSLGLLLLAFGCRAGGPVAAPEAPRRDPCVAQQRNEQALTLIAEGRSAEAEAALRSALDTDPYCGPAYSNLGVVLLQQGKYYEAAWHLRYACQLMPRASQPRANLGILYETVGRYGPAEEELRDALTLAPEDVEIIGHLARIHVRQGKHTEETVAWLEAIATQDDDKAWRDWARQRLLRVSDNPSAVGR